MLRVRQGEEYSIVVNNPLPVRVAAAVSVDGLNTVDGQRSTPRTARKWMIDPYGSVTITGWQTGSDSNRRFVFTRQDSSYAQWREKKDGKPLTRNLGVIGVAWFWNESELDAALHPPQPFSDEVTRSEVAGRKSAEAPSPAAPSAGAASEGRAGTGMGREQAHHVTQVEFNANAGMFSLADVLKIYYEFAQDPPEPLPFVGEEEETQRFAPAMP